MITARTGALIVTMSLLWIIAPAAFAQNIAINTDDNAGEENHVRTYQYDADIGRVTNDDGNWTGFSSLWSALENANLTQSNSNEESDNLNAIPVDMCALTGIAIFC
jgi:hypothetical protein